MSVFRESQSSSSTPKVRLIRHEEPEDRALRSTRLGTGTLACPACDAPVAPGPEPLSVSALLACPFCLRRGPLREFLSLSPRPRPARVVVRVAQRTRGLSAGARAR